MQVAVIHNHVPKADESGSDDRLLHVIDGIRQAGHRVTLFSLWPCCEQRYFDDLYGKGVTVYAGDAERMAYYCIKGAGSWNFAEILRENRFDVALLTLWFWDCISVPEHYLDEIRQNSPSTRIVVLTDDRHGLRQQLAAEVSHSFLAGQLAMDHALREREVYRSCDMVLAISEAECEAAKALAPQVPVRVVPVCAVIHPAPVNYSSRSGLLLLGSFANDAVMDGAQWFLREIWPLVVRRIPEIKLTIAGSESGKRLGVVDSRVQILGPVRDLEQVCAKYRVFISPLRFGTGITTKNIMAMSHGITVMTTSCGAQSLGVRPGHHLITADTADDFAEALTALYDDAELCRTVAENGREHIRNHFAPVLTYLKVREALDDVVRSSPNPIDHSEPWCYRLVESSFPELAEQLMRRGRIFRTGFSLIAADELCRAGRSEEAAVRLRNLLCHWRNDVFQSRLYPLILRALLRCYVALNDEAHARSCAEELTNVTRAASTVALLGSANCDANSETEKRAGMGQDRFAGVLGEALHGHLHV